MQQLLVFQEVVLMQLSQPQNHLILICYVKISFKAVFGMENQLEDVRNHQQLVLITQEQVANVKCLQCLDKNVLTQ